MDFKPKNRDWVKNAAIVFLSIMLVLTFFSNTIMNHSLPEVATQAVTDGSITAKVRGTGTVVANGMSQVKAEQTREIRAVMIKSGQEIKAGDVLFILGEGDSEELEAAQENLRSLQLSYQRTAIGIPTFDYAADERKIEAARIERDLAYQAMEKAREEASNVDDETLKKEIEELRTLKEQTKAKLDEANAAGKEAKDAAIQRMNEAQKAYYELLNYDTSKIPTSPGGSGENMGATTGTEENTEPPTEPAAGGNSSEGTSSSYNFASIEEYNAALSAAKAEYDEAEEALSIISSDPALKALEDLYALYSERLEAKEQQAGVSSAEYQAKKLAYEAAYENWLSLTEALEQKEKADEKSQQLSYLDLQDISAQIAKAQKKIAELSGGEENQILAKVSGTVQSIECTAGDTVAKDQVLCTIEVPDMGYTLSFTATNEQARRLRVGDSASISNYYWGSEIVATLTGIKTDPKNPMSSKILTFDLTGDVTAGAELTVSVGQKSANYDVIIPNSSIRSDTNGSFVLKIEAKNSPLGNRYYASRVDIEVLASDDKNSAVTGDLSYGDYVITTGNAPVANGDMVRLADN